MSHNFDKLMQNNIGQ